MIFLHTSTVKNKRKGCENMYQKRKYKHFILLCVDGAGGIQPAADEGIL